MKNKYLTILIMAFGLPVSAMADWPVAIVDKVAFHPAQKLIKINVLSNDIGKGLKVTEVNRYSENGGTIQLGAGVNGANTIYYEARSGFGHVGEDGFWYVIEDEQGRTNAARVSVDVKPVSSALPAPQEDIVDVPQGASIRIDVLKNDLFSTTVPEQDPGGLASNRGVISSFNAWSQKGGKIEKVEVYSDSSTPSLASQRFHLKYTPKSGFVGEDAFWYVVKDSDASVLGTQPQFTKVTINVLKSETNQEPYPIANSDQSAVECLPRAGCFIRSPNVLSNDIGKDLILKLNSAWSLNGAKISVVPNHPNPPFIEYTPNPSNPLGEDKVWYVIEDAFGRQNWGVWNIN